MLWSWAVLTLAWGGPVTSGPDLAEPTEHTVIYYNARMAMREGQPLEAAKLWLLRNALEDLTESVSPHDADFNSVAWAALGEMGVCQDGQPTDEAGAGLWPLALHNWVVRNRTRKVKPKRPRPFASFEVGRQQRFISMGDVLGVEELKTVRLYRWGCARPRLALLSAGKSITADLSDRQISASLLRHLLEKGRNTLADGRVRGWATIEARLFDIDLQLTALAAREARQKARERARKGRGVGLSRESVTAMADDAPAYTLSPDGEAARILRECVNWPVREWMALSPERRLFLFDHAKAYGGHPATLDATALGIVDQLIDRGEGEEVEKWIAHRVASDDRAAQEAIWGGTRGQRLLTLDRDTGFRERSVIALHRGVAHLERGELPSAMRSMAFALQDAPDSRVADDVQSLSRRWLSYVASQFEITDDLLITLQELVPRRDYAVVLEDLMWRAAFHADQASFERGLRHQTGRGALERRVAVLHPLAKGDIGRFAVLIRDGLSESPSETLRFLNQLVQRLELEDADVRAAHLPTLAKIRLYLLPLSSEVGNTGRQSRTIASLVQRTQAIIEGLGGLGLDATARERARSLAPTGEVYAGSIRLAPADPLPWPFRASDVPAPSVFTPLKLTPEEWRDESGEWVFGWRIGG